MLYLEVGFAVECGGECHVVESSGGRPGAAEGRHARHAVLRLVRRQLAPQLVRRDVGLRTDTRLILFSERKSSHLLDEESKLFTLSPAKILKLSMTCSAVSVSVDSLVMKSKKASNET